jgi:hypothetical protein
VDLTCAKVFRSTPYEDARAEAAGVCKPAANDVASRSAASSSGNEFVARMAL